MKNPRRLGKWGGAGIQYDLTEEEAKLMDDYRRLYPVFQEHFRALLTALHDLQACAERELVKPGRQEETDKL